MIPIAVAWRRVFVSETKDLFTLSYGLAVGAVIAYWAAIPELSYVLGHRVLLLFLGSLVVLTAVFFLLQALVRHVWHRRWRHILSLVVMPFVVAVPLLGALGHGIDASWLRLQVTKPLYIADMPGRASDDTKPSFFAWDWDISAVREGYQSEASLIYDESDQLAGSRFVWSEALKAHLAAPQFRDLAGFRSFFDGDSRTTMRRLDGHFYLVTEISD